MSDGVLAKRPQFPNNDLDTLCEWGSPLAAIRRPPWSSSSRSMPASTRSIGAFRSSPRSSSTAGARVKLWWVIEGGVIEYQHAGTRWANDGAVPRRALLTLLSARRLLLETFGAKLLVAGAGVEPTISGL